MKIREIIDTLKKSEYKGFQIEKRVGILTSTWLIFKQNEKYFYFDINQKIEFVERYCYSEIELLKEFKNANFSIEENID
ncbi:hypothetical protein [Flavobacterium sp.]|jgi:hypothetical protein|uniref:hypothetical protein n=1 Tax=Flavobacterium sp. TaxID=239 RepID=UPI0037C19ACE